MDPSLVILNHLRAVGFWTTGGNFGHPLCTRTGLGGAPPLDDHAGEISRRAAAERSRIRRRWPPWVTGNFPLFRPFQAGLYLLSTIFGPSELISVVLFLHIPHRLKVTTKTKLADSWIEFSGHHSDCWTKVMVLMSSWSLGLSIDMWFVNFGRRLVSFPFLGCFG